MRAGLELNRLTAGTLAVENNELTGNVVRLVVCPASYCYADGTYGALAKDGLTPDEVIATGLKVPTLTANRIYNNGKVTGMPGRFARVDVVNALTGTHLDARKNVLVLGGNYLTIARFSLREVPTPCPAVRWEKLSRHRVRRLLSWLRA